MIATDLIGTAAAFCTTSAFVPQLIRVWITRRADDISTAMYVVFVTGVVLWLIYGVRIQSMPIILSNALALLTSGSILVMKLVFESRRKRGLS